MRHLLRRTWRSGLVAELRDMVELLRAKIVDLKRQLGGHAPKFTRNDAQHDFAQVCDHVTRFM